MIHHVNILKFNNWAEDRGRIENIAITRDILSKFFQQCDLLVRYEITTDLGVTPNNSDIYLKTVHKDRASLNCFFSSPEYLQVMGRISKLLVSENRMEFESQTIC